MSFGGSEATLFRLLEDLVLTAVMDDTVCV